MDYKIKTALNRVMTLLEEEETVQNYKEAEQKIRHHKITRLEEDIEAAQKNSVHLNHYGKQKAYERSKQTIDELYQQLEMDDSVRYYRESLKEADELLHYVAQRIEHAVNEEE